MPFLPSSKILAIHAGGIGDLLLSLPALRAFRQAFQDFPLELMGFPERLTLIAHDLKARSLHSIDQAGMAYFYAEGGSLPSDLVQFFSSFSAALILGRSRAQTLAENLKRANLQSVFFLSSFPPEGEKTHVTEHLLRALRSFGIKGSDFFNPLSIPDETLFCAQEFLNKSGWQNGRRILAIHPGSGSPVKNWSPQKFARVADWASEHALVLLISGPAQDGMAEVRHAIKRADPIIASYLPLLTLAAILGNCSAYLGNDSGITHLAGLLGIPTFAIFGPTDPLVWGPRGSRVQIITASEPCFPCSCREKRKCLYPCLEKIEAEVLMKSLAPFIK